MNNMRAYSHTRGFARVRKLQCFASALITYPVGARASHMPPPRRTTQRIPHELDLEQIRTVVGRQMST